MTTGMTEVHMAFLDALGLRPEDHIVAINIRVRHDAFPTVTVMRNLMDGSAIKRVIQRLDLVPRTEKEAA